MGHGHTAAEMSCKPDPRRDPSGSASEHSKLGLERDLIDDTLLDGDPLSVAKRQHDHHVVERADRGMTRVYLVPGQLKSVAAIFVLEANGRFAQWRHDGSTRWPDGYRVQWLGMFENLDRARVHFRLLIPTTVALIFLLLWVTFQSFRAAILVLAGIPFACIGGILALYLRDMHINVSTGVGFSALFGIAIMDGVLMVRGITVCRERGMELRQAIVREAPGRGPS